MKILLQNISTTETRAFMLVAASLAAIVQIVEMFTKQRAKRDNPDD